MILMIGIRSAHGRQPGEEREAAALWQGRDHNPLRESGKEQVFFKGLA
jgi:hypothetical protein